MTRSNFLSRLTTGFLWLGGAILVASLLLGLWGGVSKVLISEFTDLILVVGLTLMGIIPGFLLFFTARSVKKYGPSYGAGTIAVLFALPLILCVIVLAGISSLALWATLVFGALALLILLWGILIIRHTRRTRR